MFRGTGSVLGVNQVGLHERVEYEERRYPYSETTMRDEKPLPHTFLGAKEDADS